MRRLLPSCIALTLTACASAPGVPAAATSQPVAPIEVPAIVRPDGETAQWWFRSGAAAAANRGAMQGQARNVVLFVGDGMSLETVAAARILAGQRAGQPGEEYRLSWEDFPYTALSRTYNIDLQTPDSAGTMSAMATGVKTRAGVLSIAPEQPRGDCSGVDANHLVSVLELAQAAGMATGIVTTTRITHATPGATYARSPDRNWENDSQIPDEARAQGGCTDIAAQLLHTPFGRGPDVMFGGGRRNFLPAGQPDPEHPELEGEREDGRDLLAEWQARNPDGAFVWNRDQLAAAQGRSPVLGLFEYDHLHFEHERPDDPGEPSLAEMTREAITRLQSAGGDDGFALVVEGGRIDHAHHYGNAYRALDETISLAEAVRVAAELTSESDTLILVTADHAHTMTFAGYPARGNPILDKVRDADQEYATDKLGLPYTTLGYANGPGYTGASQDQPAGPKHYPHMARGAVAAHGRPDLTEVDTSHPDYMQESVVPMGNESHGGQDVGIWARGPGAQAVRGNVEQHTIYHFMVQATPRLRDRLCQAGLCNADGVPVELPRPQDLALEPPAP